MELNKLEELLKLSIEFQFYIDGDAEKSQIGEFIGMVEDEIAASKEETDNKIRQDSLPI